MDNSYHRVILLSACFIILPSRFAAKYTCTIMNFVFYFFKVELIELIIKDIYAFVYAMKRYQSC